MKQIRTLIEYFDDYYETDDILEKEQIKADFKEELWECIPYQKSYKKDDFYFDIYENAVRDKELIPIFKEYKDKSLPQTIRTKYYIWTTEQHITFIDTVKIHINNQFARGIDKDVFITEKKYYYHLANTKNIYFDYINGKYNAEDIPKLLEENYQQALHYKAISDSNKYQMTWDEYKDFINKCFDRIFDNYVSWDDKVLFDDEVEWQHLNRHDNWNKDAAWVIGYVNNSLEGYFKTLLAKGMDFSDKVCEDCGAIFSYSRKSKKCERCAREHKQKYNKAYYEVQAKDTTCKCQRCGSDIIYNKRKRKYCDDCKKIIKRESNKKQYIKRNEKIQQF